MTLDFNDAEPQRDFEPIPAGTIVKVYATLRPGGLGDGGWLTPSKSSDGQYLNFELTIVTDGPYRGRKIWTNMTAKGGSLDEQGQSKAGKITKTHVRAMLNSARNASPDDMSDAARAKRVIQDYGALNGLEFGIRVGLQPPKDGYAAKNTVSQVIEPNHKDYQAVMSGASGAPAGGAPMPSAPAPAWAGGGQPQGGQAGAAAPPPQQQQPPSGVPSWAQ